MYTELDVGWTCRCANRWRVQGGRETKKSEAKNVSSRREGGLSRQVTSPLSHLLSPSSWSLLLLVYFPCLAPPSLSLCLPNRSIYLKSIHTAMSLPHNVHVSTHPCLQAKLSQLRSKSTSTRETRDLVHEIATILGVEAFAAGLRTTRRGTVQAPVVYPVPAPAC